MQFLWLCLKAAVLIGLFREKSRLKEKYGFEEGKKQILKAVEPKNPLKDKRKKELKYFVEVKMDKSLRTVYEDLG